MTQPQKMPVHSSHLALRFYKHDGWTKEILDQYLKMGRVRDQIEGQEVRDYWFLDHNLGSCFDMDRLYNDRVSKVLTYDGKEGDLEYMRRMNW